MDGSVWIWGKLPAALDFFYRMQGLGKGRVFYSEHWPESISIMEDCKEEGTIYAFPDEGQHSDLPRFFLALSARSRYELRVYYPVACAWYLPQHEIEQVEDVRFLCFSFREMSLLQRCIKRGGDILFALSGLLVLSPLFLLCAVLVKTGSEGSIFYSQERIGKGGRPFKIHKFRSMRMDAEADIPRLAESGDLRVTTWGKIMRRFRFDELPQLYNILKGDMTMVSYRPEREYFIRQIEKAAPYYSLLFGVRPGASSFAVVDFGYVDDVPQMVMRLSCDMNYLQRISLRQDMMILWRTLRVLFHGLGK